MNPNPEWLSTVVIRLWRESDLPALEWDGEYSCYRRVYKNVFQNSFRGITRPFVAETAADGIIGQVILTERPPSETYDPNRYTYFLTSFRVKPAFRNRGLGSRMLVVCGETARRHKITSIFLNCSRENSAGKHFYLMNGFSVVREELTSWSYVDPAGVLHNQQELSYLMRRIIF